MAEKTLQRFADNDALLQHIMSQKPAEELVTIPEWGIDLMCRALSSPHRLEIEGIAWIEEEKRTDYRKAFYPILMYGCVNPETNEQFFKPEHEAAIMTHGGPVEVLAIKVLQLSGLLPAQQQDAKKN
jgi:hypothetical protein